MADVAFVPRPLRGPYHFLTPQNRDKTQRHFRQFMDKIHLWYEVCIGISCVFRNLNIIPLCLWFWRKYPVTWFPLKIQSEWMWYFLPNWHFRLALWFCDSEDRQTDSQTDQPMATCMHFIFTGWWWCLLLWGCRKNSWVPTQLAICMS